MYSKNVNIMTEKNETYLSFSGNPEYIDMFNDEKSSLINNEDVMLGALCNGDAGSCALQQCTSQLNISNYYASVSIGIKVVTKYVDFNTNFSTGGTLHLKYKGTTNKILINNGTYNFSYKTTNINEEKFSGHFFNMTLNSLTQVEANLIAQIFNPTGASLDFDIISFTGHNIPESIKNLKLNAYSKVATGIGTSTVEIYTSNIYLLTLPAKIYKVQYSSGVTSGTSAQKKEYIKNLKLGTTYKVYANESKNSGGLNPVHNVAYVTDTSTLATKPSYFYIQTTINSVYFEYTRPGSVTGKYTCILSGTNLSDGIMLPPVESNYQLATLYNLYDENNGLGNKMFNRIFSSSTNTNRAYMVLTPYQYNALTPNVINQNVFYKNPVMFYSGASSNTNCCLRISDISTFDKWMYVASAASSSISTSKNYVEQAYKDYPVNLIEENNGEWSYNTNPNPYDMRDLLAPIVIIYEPQIFS